LGLITVGAALRLDGASAVRGISIWLLAVQLLALPLIAAGVGGLLGLEGLNYQVVVLFAALPTASSAYILAMRMGGDGRSVAWLISATTLGSMLTLPLWAAWLSR
ncbi:MAG: AEC family transporter, partial [Azonexus sp.]